MGLGATGRHPPPPAATGRPPFQGGAVEAFRPAWASWIPGMAPCDEIKELMRSKAAAWVSFQRPVSAGEIRPSGVTAVASTITSPAPPTARLLM